MVQTKYRMNYFNAINRGQLNPAGCVWVIVIVTKELAALQYAPLSPLSILVAGGGISSTPECQAFWSASRLPLSLQQWRVRLVIMLTWCGRAALKLWKALFIKGWMTTWKPASEGRDSEHVCADSGIGVIVWVEEREMEIWSLWGSGRERYFWHYDTKWLIHVFEGRQDKNVVRV